MPPPRVAAAALGVSYRPERDEDRAFAASVYASTRAEEVAQSGWPLEMQHRFLAQQEEAQHLHYRHHYPDAEWLIVERGGEAVGRLYLEEWPTQFRVIDISLMPEARGSGIGAAILVDIGAAAAAVGKRVSIHVEKNNRARDLYLRLGFEAVEDKGIYDLMEWDPAAAPPAVS